MPVLQILVSMARDRSRETRAADHAGWQGLKALSRKR